MAMTLDVGYVTVDRHLSRICTRLKLPTRYVIFSKVPLDGNFTYKNVSYQRVDRAMDRFGAYNAQNKDGNRVLIPYHTVVERVD